MLAEQAADNPVKVRQAIEAIIRASGMSEEDMKRHKIILPYITPKTGYQIGGWSGAPQLKKGHPRDGLL